MYFVIDRRQNLTLREEIDQKIATLRQAQNGLSLLNDIQPSQAARDLLAEVDQELASAIRMELALAA